MQVIYLICTGSCNPFTLYSDTFASSWHYLESFANTNEGDSILQILETKQKWLDGVTNHEFPLEMLFSFI